MGISRLSYFVRIAADGSLSKAAGTLRIAQPALSRQMRLLEEELGVALFERTQRGMQLTEDGGHLYTSVAGPLQELDQALQNFRSAASGIEGTITIGMPPSLGRIVAKPLIDRVGVELPNIKLRMVEAYSGSLADWISRGLMDFALLEETPKSARLSEREVFKDRLMLIGNSAANLDPASPVDLRDAARLPLIVPCQPYGLRGVLNEAVARARTVLNVRFESDSTDLMARLVDAGAGYAILPLCYLDKELLGGLSFSPIVKPTCYLRVYLIWRNYRIDNTSVLKMTDKVIGRIIEGIFSADLHTTGDLSIAEMQRAEG